jgi:hypothetical protein
MDNEGKIEPKSGSIVEEPGGSQSISTQNQTTSASGAVTEKAWKDYGIDGWDGKSREQIAREVAFQRNVSGRQSGELGKLRKEYQTTQQKLAEFEKLAGGKNTQQGQAVAAAIEDMSEGDKLGFFKELEEGNPRKALRMALGDLGIPKNEDIQKMIAETIEKQLGQYHDWSEETNLRTSNPDYAKHEEMVNWLRDKNNEEGLPNRPRQDCLELCILGEQDTALAGMTYDLLKTSNLPFQRCKQLAQLEMTTSAANETAKNTLKGEIKKGNKTSPMGSKSTQSDDQPKSWEDL